MYILERTLLDRRGTMGTLNGPNIPTIHTLEEPWNANKRGFSCIPEGTYHCIPHAWGPDRGKFHIQQVWEITKVPNRIAVLIHSGNTLKDTEGCVLVGLHAGQFSLVDSMVALNKLRAAIGQSSFDLKIVNKGQVRE